MCSMASSAISTVVLLVSILGVIQAQDIHLPPIESVNQVEDIKYIIPRPSSDLIIYALPVGQGDCTIIQCPNGNLVVVDCGSSGSSGGNRLSRTQVRQFFGLQIDKVVAIIITHPDRDHFNYLPDIFNNFEEIKAVIIGGKLTDYKGRHTEFDAIKEWLQNVGEKLHTVNDGEHCIGNENCVIHDIDTNFCKNKEIRFNVLAANVGKHPNEKSIVIKVIHKKWSILLPGDMEGKAADYIVDEIEPELKSVVYKMAHHGASKSANKHNWLEAIKPQHTFSSNGYNFGNCRHPRCETIERLKNLGTIANTSPHPFYCGNPKEPPLHDEKFDKSMLETSPSSDKVCLLTYSSSDEYVSKCWKLNHIYIPDDDSTKCPEEEDLEDGVKSEL